MKKNLIKCVAVVMAGAMIMSLASCEKSSESSESGVRVDSGQDLPDNYYVDEKDMPYGATMTELYEEKDSNVKITIEFDNRYFTMIEEDHTFPEVYKVSDYMYGLQEKDTALLESVMYKPYLEQSFSTIGCENMEDYVNQFYNMLSEKLGGDFIFTYLHINDCKDETDEETKAYFNELDASLAESVDADIVDRITSRKLIYIGGDTMYELKGGEGGGLLSEKFSSPIMLYLYEIDGNTYLL